MFVCTVLFVVIRLALLLVVPVILMAKAAILIMRVVSRAYSS